MTPRDLLMEFIQWLAVNPSGRFDLDVALQEDDPVTTLVVIDAFFAASGEPVS